MFERTAKVVIEFVGFVVNISVAMGELYDVMASPVALAVDVLSLVFVYEKVTES